MNSKELVCAEGHLSEPDSSLELRRARFEIKSCAPLLPTRRANAPAIPLSLMSCRPLLSRRFLLTAAPRRLFSTALPFPTIQTCPDPTCQCPPTPDLDIDHEKSLSGLVGPYKQHLVVATGQPDWTSRIENDQNFGSLAVGVKRGLRRDVRYSLGLIP
jgi:hypothetical protein